MTLILHIHDFMHFIKFFYIFLISHVDYIQIYSISPEISCNLGETGQFLLNLRSNEHNDSLFLIFIHSMFQTQLRYL